VASEPVQVRVGQVAVAGARARLEDAAWARVGVLLEGADGPLLRGAPLWGPVLRSAGDAVELSCALAVPFGATRARVVLAAGGDGTVALDDASLVLADAAPGPGEVGEFDVQIAAERGDLVLARSDRPVAVLRATAGVGAAAAGHDLEVATVSGEPRLELVHGDAHRGATDHRLTIDLPVGDEDAARRVAVVADGEYRAFGGEFEADGVTQLLLGRGLDMVRLEFDEPVAVRGRRDAAGATVDVEMGRLGRLAAQLAFTAERGAAATLASATRRAEQDGRLGDALAGWSRLLATYAFQDELVAEAEAAIARITTTGSGALDELGGAVDRAGFFALPGVYDDCEARALALVERFTPQDGGTNPVLESARAMLARVRDERATLVEAGTDAGASSRLDAIKGFLERTGRDDLSERFADGR